MMVKVYSDSANSWVQTLILVPISVAFSFVFVAIFLSLFDLQNYLFSVFVPLSAVVGAVVFMASHKVVIIYNECIVVSRGRFKWKFDELVLFKNVRSVYYYDSSMPRAGRYIKFQYMKGEKLKTISMRSESLIWTRKLFMMFKDMSIEVGVHPEAADIWNLRKEFGVVKKIRR
jgi:hypothetical protein